MSDISNTGILLGWRKTQRSPRPFGESRIEPEHEPIWHSGEGHLITIAPTGAWKSETAAAEADTINVVPFPSVAIGETRV